MLFGIESVVRNHQESVRAERIAKEEQKYLGELRKQTGFFRASYRFSVLDEKYKQTNDRFEQNLILQEMKAAVAEAVAKDDSHWAYEILFNNGWQEKLQVDAETIKEMGRKAIAAAKGYAPYDEREAIESEFKFYSNISKSVKENFDQKYWDEHPESHYEWMGLPQNRAPRPEEVVLFTSIEERRQARGYERPNYPEEQSFYDDSHKKLTAGIELSKRDVKNKLERKISEIEQRTGLKQ